MSDLRNQIAGFSPAKRRALARRLLAGKGEAKPTTRIPPRPRGQGPWPLSFGQERLWFLTELEPDSRVYNLRYALRFRGELAPQGLAFGLREVIRRHESLRTTLAAYDGKPAQVIHDPPPAFTLPIVALERLPATAQEVAVKRVTAAIADRRFDLARGPLMRALLMRLSPTEHILVLAIHHIVSDGWSLGGCSSMRSRPSTRHGAQVAPRRWASCPSRLRILLSGSVSGCKGKCWSRSWPTGDGSWPVRPRCWSCPPTGHARCGAATAATPAPCGWGRR